VLFGLSFLDCICCGFGAIILLFVITMGSQTEAIREVRDRLQQLLRHQLVTLAEFKIEREELERVTARARQVTEAQEEEDTLKALLEQMERQIQYQQAGRRKLLVEIDQIKLAIAARQKRQEIEILVPPTPVGLPALSNHICFVIDSSGSMRNPTTERIWEVVQRKFDEVLDAYPQVEGIQFLDADGRFIIGSRTGDVWLPDTIEVRNAIKDAIADYNIYSNSNPVPGIMRALRNLYKPDQENMKMGIFIIGDEFTGTADAVLRRIDELNPVRADGTRAVVINAIGFPTAVRMGFSMGNTGVKFANLMRELTFQHGGAFIALQDIEIR
jgi:hypothetical protein